MSQLAIHGGPQAAGAFKMPEWPILTDEDRHTVMDALESKENGAGQQSKALTAYDQDPSGWSG
ncbi:MAG: hypothetical protein RML36_11725 [Anaerolineae bacterium]|nr:hypothetical protein [Anaerolineae bacterium]MDW8100137.1 hypothetical protein [Anaerolineae bacterium]